MGFDENIVNNYQQPENDFMQQPPIQSPPQNTGQDKAGAAGPGAGQGSGGDDLLDMFRDLSVQPPPQNQSLATGTTPGAQETKEQLFDFGFDKPNPPPSRQPPSQQPPINSGGFAPNPFANMGTQQKQPALAIQAEKKAPDFSRSDFQTINQEKYDMVSQLFQQ